MKPRIPDQAEKLRQLAQQESTPLEPDQSVAILEQEEPTIVSTPVPKESTEPPGEPVPPAWTKADPIPTEADLSQETVEIRKSAEFMDFAARPEPKQILGSPAVIAKEPVKPEFKPVKPFPVKRLTREDLLKVSFNKPEPVKEKQEEKVNQLLASRRFPLEGKTHVIAITGGKGGVGKSNITCNLGIAMAQMKRRVLILDADLSLANIDVLLGLTPRVNLAHVLRGEKTLSEIVITGPEGIQIIPGGSGLEELTNLSEEQMGRLFDAFASIEPVPDVLLIDTAAGIHPNVMQFLLAADQTIVITTPEPTAYTDAYALIKTLTRHDPSRDIGVVINMAKDHREAMEVVKLMFQMCRQFLNIMFNNLGYIPRDSEVLKAVRHQRPLLLISPTSPAAKEIRSIASTILQVDKKDRSKKGLRGFFQRLFTSSQPGRESSR